MRTVSHSFIFKALSLTIILLGNSVQVQSQTTVPSKYALTASAGTNGIGGDLTLAISDYLNTRIGYHGFTYSMDGTLSDSDPEIQYDGTLSISSFSLMVDYYPFKKVVGLSVGAFLHSLTLDALAKPTTAYQVDDKTFDVDELGTLSANLKYSGNLMPYAGIVFSNPVARGIPVKLHVQAGMIYSKQPDLQLSGTGMIAPTADNQASLQKGLDEFKFLPIVNIGFSYRFGKR